MQTDKSFLQALHQLSCSTVLEEYDRILGQIMEKWGKVAAYASLTLQDNEPFLLNLRHSFNFDLPQLAQVVPLPAQSFFIDDTLPYQIVTLASLPLAQQEILRCQVNSLPIDYLIGFQEEQTLYAAVLLRGDPQLQPEQFTLLMDTTWLVLKSLFFARQAATDQLTHLYRRAFLTRRLYEHLKNPPRKPLVVMMIDIDNFKKINDQYGHIYGDFVLCAVSSEIKKNFREQDLIARFGGDEFATFLPETCLSEGACIAQRVRRNVAQLLPGRAESVVSVSIGITSCLPQHALHYGPELLAQQLLTEADNALCQAKKWGRNCVVCQKMPADSCQPRLELISSLTLV